MKHLAFAVALIATVATPANAGRRVTLDLDLARITTHDSIRKAIDYRSGAIVSTYRPIPGLTLLASAGAKSARIGLVNTVPVTVSWFLWSGEAHYDWPSVRATLSTGQDIGTAYVGAGAPNCVHFVRMDVDVHLVR